MAAVKIKCPHCGTAVKAPEKADGKVMACPACTKKFQVKLHEGVEELDEEGRTAVANRRTRPEPPPRNRSNIRDDEDSERQTRRSRDRASDDLNEDGRHNRAKGGGFVLLAILIAIPAGAVLLCGFVGVLFLLAVPAEDGQPAARKQQGARDTGQKVTLPPGDMTLKQFIIQKPDSPTAVQVECEAATYYNYAFSDCAETHYSFSIKTGSPSFTRAHVYAPKDSKEGRRLSEMLKDGAKRAMTLRIQRLGRFGEPLPAGHDSCFALVGIVDGSK
jgi:DNA-directed RNA polymerase subunit M/transcription elongation factor TFIIS